MQERLPDYMLPAAYVFLARWPISPNGKVDRKALPDPNWQRSAASRFVAPAPGIERRIAEIWQAVLGLDRIGATENFFEIGGHSLLATQIVSRLRAAFGLEVGLRAFFENPTIAEQSRYLDRAGVGAASAPQDPVRDTMQEEFVI
jgi:acyl carrier protein